MKKTSKHGFIIFGLVCNDEIIIATNINDFKKIPETLYLDKSSHVEVDNKRKTVEFTVNCSPSALCRDKYCIVKEADAPGWFDKFREYFDL